VVDERALIDTLRGGRIAGAALDVFEQGPSTGQSAARNGQRDRHAARALLDRECFHNMATTD